MATQLKEDFTEATRWRRRPRPTFAWVAQVTSGVLLLVLGVVPLVVSSLGSSLGLVSLAMVSFASVIAGALYMWSAALANRPTPPRRNSPGRRTPGGRPRGPRA